jgi:CBS domain-containing protein
MSGRLVKDLMTRGVPSIEADSLATDVSRRIVESSAGLVAVCDHGRLIGTLTDHDVVSERETSSNGFVTKVADLLSADLSYCFEDTDVEEAVRLMMENKLDRLVVLDRRGHVAGALTMAVVSRHRSG